MLKRRTVLGGAAGIGTLAVFAYEMAPAFWRRVSEDMKREVEPAARIGRISARGPNKGCMRRGSGTRPCAISMDGFLIVTDPVFSTRIGVNVGPVTVGLKRLVAPAAAIAEIPRPDLILLSHAHMDHFDLPSLRKLEDRGTAVITASNTSDLLRVKRYGSVRELRWNETARVGPAEIRAIEVKHWGARMRSDTYRSYNGYVIEAGRYRVLFGGDTAYTESFRQVRTSKPVDLAIMPIGAYDPWIRAHCNPEQALAMANHAGAEFGAAGASSDFRVEPGSLGWSRLRATVEGGGVGGGSRVVRDFGGEAHLG